MGYSMHFILQFHMQTCKENKIESDSIWVLIKNAKSFWFQRLVSTTHYYFVNLFSKYICSANEWKNYLKKITRKWSTQSLNEFSIWNEINQWSK